MVNIGWQNTNKEKVLESRAKKTPCYNNKEHKKQDNSAGIVSNLLEKSTENSFKLL